MIEIIRSLGFVTFSFELMFCSSMILLSSSDLLVFVELGFDFLLVLLEECLRTASGLPSRFNESSVFVTLPGPSANSGTLLETFELPDSWTGCLFVAVTLAVPSSVPSFSILVDFSC